MQKNKSFKETTPFIQSQQFTKEKYYYYYNNNVEITTTVCLLYDENKRIWSRGLSILMEGDEYNQETGNALAKAKAIRGLKNSNRVDPITYDAAIKILIENCCPFIRSQYYTPKLSFYEKRLLFGKNWKKKVIEKIYTINTNGLKGLFNPPIGQSIGYRCNINPG